MSALASWGADLPRLLLLAVAAAIAALAARLLWRTGGPGATADAPSPVRGADPRDAYARGVQHLLADDPDSAFAELVRVVAVDPAHLEAYFTLGRSFRRRGDLERAIAVHTSLLARAELGPEPRVRALLALGEDHRRFGMLDRAARRFEEALEEAPNAELASIARSLLRDVYEDARDWENAIAVETAVTPTLEPEREPGRLAHLWARLACDRLAAGELADARAAVDAALRASDHCAEAHLAAARLAAHQAAHPDCDAGDTAAAHARRAADAYVRTLTLAPWLAAELAPALAEVAARSGDAHRHARTLEELAATVGRGARAPSSPEGGAAALVATADVHAAPSIVPASVALRVAAAQVTLAAGDTERALGAVDALCAAHPGYVPALRVRCAGLEAARADAGALGRAYRALLEALGARGAAWVCTHCGLGTTTFEFRCPGCRVWDSLRERAEAAPLASTRGAAALPPAPVLTRAREEDSA